MGAHAAESMAMLGQQANTSRPSGHNYLVEGLGFSHYEYAATVAARYATDYGRPIPLLAKVGQGDNRYYLLGEIVPVEYEDRD